MTPLEQAQELIKQGDKAKAREILANLVQSEPKNVDVWLLLVAVLDDPKQIAYCNERVRVLQNQSPNKPIIISPPQINQQVLNTPQVDTTKKKCPYCAEWILQDAIICRFCGRELPNKKIPAYTPPATAKIPPSKKAVNKFPCVAIVIGIVVIIVIACLLFAALGSSISTTGNSTSPATPTEASVMCEYFVKNRLKAPSTAKFPHYWELEITTYGKNEGVKDAFRVKGYVDAQNGFGAMIRSNYICDVQYISEDNWNLINLTIE
jgi:hypothetical protein